MRWRCLFLLLLITGCGETDPVDPGPVALAPDARLGALVMEASPLRETTLSAFYVGDRVYLVVYQGPGDDGLGMMVDAELRFFEVDDVTLAVTEHPAPPVAPTPRSRPSTDVDGNALVYATAPTEGEVASEIAFFDGSSWAAVPLPPLPMDEAADELVSRSNGRIVARAGNRAFLYDGATWIEAELPEAVLDLGIGPWDAEGFRLVYVLSDRLVTQRYSGSTAETRGDPEALMGDFRGLVGSIHNGDTSSFQIWTGNEKTGGFSLLYEDGVLSVVDRVDPGFFYAAPGSDTALFVQDGDPERGLTFAAAGVRGDVALRPFAPRLSCGCSRADDPTCDCIERAPATTVYAGAPSADRLAMAMIDEVDGGRAVHVRVVDLPIVESPFVDRDAACDLPCGAEGAGLECVLNTLGEAQCVPVGSVPDGGLADAGPPSFDGGPIFGATMTGTFARSSEGPSPVLVEVVPADEDAEFEVGYESGFTIDCTPETEYRVTIRSADAHRPITLNVTSPSAGDTLDLGDFTMIIGEALGPAFGDVALAPTTVVSPVDQTMVVVGGDGWHVVSADADDARGFVATHLPGTPGLMPTSRALLHDVPRLFVTNDDTWVLAETATGLMAIDWRAATLVGEVALDADLSTLTFADATPVAMLSRATGPVIVGWEGGAFSELLAIDAEGEEDWLNPDGTRVMRIESGAVVEYDIATGARTVVEAMGTGRWMRLGNDDLVGVQREGMDGLGTCWLDAAGCAATIRREGGGATGALMSLTGFAPSTSSEFLFYARTEGGLTTAYRYSLGGGSTAVAGVAFADASFAWLRAGDAVTFEDATGYRAINLATGEIIHTEPGRFAAEQRSSGEILLTPATCAPACDLVVLDAEAGTTTRVPGAGNAVLLGPELETRATSAADEVALGARTVAREIGAADEVAGPEPRVVDHLGAPCWPFAWLEQGVGNTPIARTLYCVR